jgi:hypothetical protein
MTSKLQALMAEAEGVSLPFEYDGIEYFLVAQWEPKTLLLLADGKILQAARTILGEKQWGKFREKYKSAKKVEGLLEASFGSLGLKKSDVYQLLAVMSDDELLPLLELDLRALGLDLRDFFKGTLSLRLLVTALAQLPSESRLIVQLGKPDSEWSRVEYLLADIADLLNYNVVLSHVNAQLQGMKKPVKAPKPIYKRPADRDQPKVFNSAVELHGFLNGV